MNDTNKKQQALMMGALKEIKKLRTEVSELKEASEQSKEPIAVIGMSCRYPGGVNSPRAFWEFLKEGQSGITELSNERWDMDQFYDATPGAAGKIYTRSLGMLDQISGFDAELFGIAPRELDYMDPQHRLMLEVAWECFENAAIAPESLAGQLVGTFLGISTQDFMQLSARHGGIDDITPWSGTGVALSALPGRLAYLLDLKGPAVPVDTACSSSLVATHMAVQSLRQGDSNMALVGGVNLAMNPATSLIFSRASMLSPTGSCKSFDAKADGYVRAEGCGVVLLKRLSDAVADGDKIHALIKGGSVNQDGRSQGLTAPNENAQAAVITQALKNSNVTPEQVNYVEAHGTGTSLGDPIEMNAIGRAYCEDRNMENPLWVGSLKTNVGHMEAAAGIGGMQKIILSLKNGGMPAHLNFDEPNPMIDWENLPVQVPKNMREWKAQDPVAGELHAGVSSFGFTGTNAHIILAQAPPLEATPAKPMPELFKLSAAGPAALKAMTENMVQYLSELTADEFESPAYLRDLCMTANKGRNDFRYRESLVVESTAQLLEKLRNLAGIEPQPLEEKGAPAFLFTGQGGLYSGMGRELYEAFPLFKKYIDICSKAFGAHHELDLRDVLWGSESDRLQEPEFAQPAIFALEYALGRFWLELGVAPGAMIGHSVGEYAAACLAGVFTLKDAMLLIVSRGKLTQAHTSPGVMVEVNATLETLGALTEGHPGVSPAAYNSDDSVVVAGMEAPIEAFLTSLDEKGVKHVRLKTNRAYHTSSMEPMVAAFEKIAAKVTYRKPRMRIIPTVGDVNDSSQMASKEYWVRHITAAVKFSEAVKSLGELKVGSCLEIGPARTLIGLVRKNTDTFTLFSSTTSNRSLETFWKSVGALYAGGSSINWSKLYQGRGALAVNMPTYPFQRKEYWLGKIPAVQNENLLLERSRNFRYRNLWREKPLVQGAAPGETSGTTKPLPGDWLVCQVDDGNRSIVEELKTVATSVTTANSDFRAKAMTPGETEGYRLNPRQAEQMAELLNHWLESVDNPAGILISWGAEASAHESEQLEFLSESTLNMIQKLILLQPGKPIPLWFYAARPVEKQDSSRYWLQSSLWRGMGQVIALEHPQYWGGILDAEKSAPETAKRIVSELTAGDGEDIVKYEGEKRLVARLVSDEKSPEPYRALKPDPEGTYLITGGMGTLGLSIAEYLVKEGARNLALLGRSGFEYENVSDNQLSTISRMREAGARLSVHAVDVSDGAALAELITSLQASDRPLKGIVHAAGRFDLTPIEELDWETCRSVLSGKVLGAWNLHELTKEIALDFFVNYSSIASVWGAGGNFHYAAANGALDKLAEIRRQMGLPVTNVNWGPWQESAMLDDLQEASAKRGLGSIPTKQGLAILGDLMSRGVGDMVVANMNWAKFLPLMQIHGDRPLFSEIELQGNLAEQDFGGRNLREELADLSIEEQAKQVQSYLVEQICHAIGSDPTQFDPNQPLVNLGLDSLMALEFRERVRVVMAYDLPIGSLLSGASVAHITQAICESFQSGTNIPLPTLEVGEKPLVEMVEGEL